MAARNGRFVTQDNANKLMTSMKEKQSLLGQKDELMAMQGLKRVDSSSLESIHITEPDIEVPDLDVVSKKKPQPKFVIKKTSATVTSIKAKFKVINPVL